MRRFVALCLIGLFLAMPFVVAQDSVGPYNSSSTVSASGICVVRVQYEDGYPRSHAYVKVYSCSPPAFVGLFGCTTNESGYCQGYLDLLPNTLYYTNATYPDGITFFGDNSFITDSDGGASFTTTANFEITPPNITVLSPQNQTYEGRLVPLNFTIYDYSAISWMGYSLDGQANATVTGNITLNVDKGSHSVVVYANDTYGNMGSSDVVHFSSSGGCVVITVNYMDGYPRSGADVLKVDPKPDAELGTTGEDGQVTRCGVLAPGNYIINAFYPSGVKFGGDSEIVVNENGDGHTTITCNYAEITPPLINIVSPQNQTYTNGSIPLTFAVYDYSSISWIGLLFG
jgi:hypothetical protein